MSLIAWLPLNGNIENKGLSSFTVSGTPAYVTGKLGAQAASLAKRLTFTIPELSGVTEFSIAFWCLVNADTSLSGNWVDLLAMTAETADKSRTSLFRWETCYGSEKDNVGIGAYDSGSSSIIGSNNANMLTTAKGSWRHLCAVCDPTNNIVRWYLDGNQQVTRTYNGGHLTGAGYIGENNAINGAIQDVRFYNHALSVKEVKELAKGLCMHLTLDWGGNPNIIKNSYTWMDKNTGSEGNNNYTVTKSIIEDNTAPCKWVLKRTLTNNNSSQISGGEYYSITAQGLTTSDLVSGATYTYSFWAKADYSNTVNTEFQASSVCEGQTKLSETGFGVLTTEWRKHTVTFNWTNTNKLTCCFYTLMPANSTTTVYICGIKLEAGAKATPYQPNSAETVYTTHKYSAKAFEDVSGYNKDATNTGCTNGGSNTPKGLSCTSKASGNIIQLTRGYLVGTKLYSFTVSMWCKCSSLNSTTPQLWSLGDIYFWRTRMENATTLRSFYIMGGNTISSDTTVPTMTDNKWHLYCQTFSYGVIKTYFDGVLKGTKDSSSIQDYITMNSTDWYLGTGNSNNTQSMVGNLSDFRFYASTLSDADVKELYNVGAQIDKTGKIFCNQFIEE